MGACVHGNRQQLASVDRGMLMGTAGVAGNQHQRHNTDTDKGVQLLASTGPYQAAAETSYDCSSSCCCCHAALQPLQPLILQLLLRSLWYRAWCRLSTRVSRTAAVAAVLTAAAAAVQLTVSCVMLTVSWKSRSQVQGGAAGRAHVCPLLVKPGGVQHTCSVAISLS